MNLASFRRGCDSAYGTAYQKLLLPLWESLERRPGFTRQWDVSVNRIRDQIAVTTVGLLGVVAEGVARA